MPTTIQTTIDLLPFPMTANELEEKLHTICDAVGCWDWQVGYDPEYNRLYLKPTAERRNQMTPNIDKIVEHYNHAREKHPYFCDWVQSEKPQSYIKQGISNRLASLRKCNKLLSERGALSWDDILDCEMWEVFEALASGDKTQAVEELYDCVAVLLRTIDVLEGRQKLSKPEEV